MCVIVDVNVAHEVFLNLEPGRFYNSRESFHEKKATFSYGGGLRREYEKNQKLKSLLALYDKMGIAIKFSDDEIDSEEMNVECEQICSDDPHIIALSRISGSRILCTNDHNLEQDFIDKKFIDNPRGKIYKYNSHKHLIREYCS